MKRLKSLSATNLKGRTFSHALAAVNIILGSNTSGKTAELLAIELALIGYSRKLGRTSAGIFSACGCPGGGATELAVGAEFTDDTRIDRRWTMKIGKISYKGPDTEAIPPVMLDPTTYFALTGPARLNYVLAQVDLAKLGLGCEALLQKLLAEALPPPGPQTAENIAFAEVFKTIHSLEATRADEDASVYKWMTAVVEDITELAKQAKAQADTHEQTLRGLTDGKAQDGDMTAIESVQPQINAARDRHTAAVQAERDALNDFAGKERAVQETRILANTHVDETATRDLITDNEQVLSRARLVPEPGARPVNRVMATGRLKDETERRELGNSQQYLATVCTEFNQITREMKQLETEVDAAAHQTTCPTCGHDITDKQKAVVAELRTRLTAITGRHVAKAALRSMVIGRLNAAEVALDTAVKSAQAWDTAAEALRKSNQDALDDWDTRHRAHTGAQRTIAQAEGRISQLQAALARNATAQAAWERLPSLEEASRAAGIAYQTAKQAIEPLAVELRTLDTRQKQWVGRTQDARRADQSREAARVAGERLAVFKAALKVVAAEKERASEAAFGALLEHARLFTDGLIEAPLQYRDGDLGFIKQGNWCSYKAWSGIEEKIGFAALGVALCQQHAGTRIVMIDELGTMDDTTLPLFMRRMFQLTDTGTIDNFVGCDWNASRYDKFEPDDRFELIQIESGKAPQK